MPYTEKKAGTSLPQNCPELELFIKAQAHIRAAVHLIDEFAGHELPQLSERQRKAFRNLRPEVISMLWECDSNVQDLMSAFLIPLFPLEMEK